eukprot:7063541-Ditylum_brightwellii.AAC.1
MLPLVLAGMQRIAMIFTWWRKEGLLVTNRSMQRDSSGGSATDATREFDYALGLASQMKVKVSYSE